VIEKNQEYLITVERYKLPPRKGKFYFPLILPKLLKIYMNMPVCGLLLAEILYPTIALTVPMES
jgi:hypothetical protein